MPPLDPITPAFAPLSFGQTHIWPSGDQITVANPRRDQVVSVPGGTTTKFLALDITYHNGTQVPESVNSIDSVLLLNVALNDVPTTRLAVSDAQRGDTTPDNVILPGRTVTYRQTFDLIDSPTPVRVQAQASGAMNDPARPVVVFEGTV
jgi:hypothetical protein